MNEKDREFMDEIEMIIRKYIEPMDDEVGGDIPAILNIEEMIKEVVDFRTQVKDE